jgi:predicted aldo/keto reductase-like oxidoreductase
MTFLSSGVYFIRREGGLMNSFKGNGISRRRFFSRTVSGMAAAGLLGGPGKELLSTPQKPESQNTGRKAILTRKLGNTGIVIPIVNMGVMNAFIPELVKRSYEIGVRYFDTAAYYQRGNNEIMVGRVIKELGVRDQVIIGTKVYIPHEQRGMPPGDAKAFFLKTAEESLKRLQTDYIDIFYIHNVQDIGYLNNPGIMEAMQILKDQKKIRFTGFTTHINMTECLNDAVRSGFYEVICTVYNYALSDETGLIEAMKKVASMGIGLIAMKTQCSQYWYRENVPGEKQKYYEGSILHTAVLKWVLRHDFITSAIPGYTTFDQMDEDFSVAYGLEYTPEEKKFLEDRQVKLAMSICRQCSRCVPSCPAGVHIPTLMRTHMYAACYGNFYEARDALDSIPRGKGLDACRLCTDCTAACVNRINIAGRIKELRLLCG